MASRIVREPLGIRWQHKQRLPGDYREPHRDPKTVKLPEQIYFSLKNSRKAEASKLTDSRSRRLDAYRLN